MMKLIFSFTLLILSGTLISAPKKSNPTFSQLITNQFANQCAVFPQEKLYLHTDKPYYSAGEDMWFKAYLVNATSHISTSLSRYVYIELISKLDSVLYRVKIKKDSIGFAGHIKLKPETPSGFYKLRAYTYWMQNAGKDYFFTKNILIGNTIDDRVTSKVDYGVASDGQIPVTVTFLDAVKNPIMGKKIEILENWNGGSKRKKVLTTNKDGKINWQIKVNPLDTTKKYMEVSMLDEKYITNFILPEFNHDYDLQFFPESGVLLNNALQTLAFKAISKNGLSEEVSGKVYTDKNEEICDFSTLHKGMGKFSIQTQPNETYYAIVKNNSGIEKRAELPKSQPNGVVLHLLSNRGKLLYEVINQTKIPDKSLYILLHSRGKVFVVQSLQNLEGQISESLLPPGIVTFAVVDSLGHTFCERLSFVRNFNLPTISLLCDKPEYGKRELVNLDLKIQTTQKTPIAGNFSISVTDSHIVKKDSLADNIMSNLLLTSDLKGYIEEPSSYFIDNKTATREKTDVLMLTQGWRRFNTSDVVKNIYAKPKFYLEVGQALSGKVLNLFNAPSKKCDIIMISPYKNIVKLAKTDTLGRYLIDGIEFPDSTTFVLKAKKPKSFTDVEILPDADDFPQPNGYIPTSTNVNNPTEQEEYFKQSKEKYYYEGGMRVINLAEVTVKAEKKTNKSESYFSGMADSEITSEQLEKFPSTSILNLLYTIPGIQVSGDKVSIRGATDNPMFLVDEIEVPDMDQISYLTSNDVESIQVFKGSNAAIFGSRGGNGVIAIKLKEGINLKAQTPISLARISPLGYQKPAEFYVPKYNVDSVYLSSNPDLRTTIYWNPQLVTDSLGLIHVKFYTADKANNYSVELEGISATGEICRFVGILRRKNE